ncbi:uncharacterized protein BBOV_IV006190 [Babesia bovis T2Bo]|uniref:uncharacterized protein n=1 Tax=Babesia bovis T2Bo TaxID=484906 RepID=UPI001D9B192F|nr:uncharacterized protein BBOV_IV006190 [Babesia bovis T2Bo]EDO06979.2 hypothetical protein BBOV_IV006190 [Babesia bovis T2Bo]
MYSDRLKPLLPLLLQRVGLVKSPDVYGTIHDLSRITSLNVAGFWKVSHSTQPWKSRVMPDLTLVADDSIRGICVLCYRICQNQGSLHDLYHRKDYILGNISNFGIDELLLLCYTMSLYIHPYSRWFNVNHMDLTSLLMACHYRLVSLLPKMTAEQFRSCLILFNTIGDRYPVFTTWSNTFTDTVIRLRDGLSKVMTSSESFGIRSRSHESDVQKLPSRVQSVYRQIYPYFEAVNTRFHSSRMYISCVIEAGFTLHRWQPESFTELLSKICVLVKTQLSNASLFSLSSLLRAVILLHDSSVHLPGVVQLEPSDAGILATRLNELCVDSYIVLPDHDGELLLPENAEQVITRLLSVCLDTASLRSLIGSLEVLDALGMLNSDLCTLYLPYIATCLITKDVSIDHVLDLLQLLPKGCCYIPFWCLHMSLLDCVSPGVISTQVDSLDRLCTSLLVLIDNLRGDFLGESHVTSTDSDVCRWVYKLDDISLLNVTNVDSMEDINSLAYIMNNRFNMSIGSTGFLDHLLSVLRRLHLTLGDAIRALDSRPDVSSDALLDSGYGADSSVIATSRLISSHVALGERIDSFACDVDIML